MKQKIKAFWNWLNKPRKIEITFYSGDDLAAEFQRTKEKIQIINFQKLMTRLIDLHKAVGIADGLLLTEDDCIQRALNDFQIAKREGRLDELNQIVKKD